MMETSAIEPRNCFTEALRMGFRLMEVIDDERGTSAAWRHPAYGFAQGFSDIDAAAKDAAQTAWMFGMESMEGDGQNDRRHKGKDHRCCGASVGFFLSYSREGAEQGRKIMTAMTLARRVDWQDAPVAEGMRKVSDRSWCFATLDWLESHPDATFRELIQDQFELGMYYLNAPEIGDAFGWTQEKGVQFARWCAQRVARIHNGHAASVMRAEVGLGTRVRRGQEIGCELAYIAESACRAVATAASDRVHAANGLRYTDADIEAADDAASAAWKSERQQQIDRLVEMIERGL